ncbi:MAG: hypothetical protein MUC78_04315 [Bacteroidales bacterium]|jgi:hypothetical protein|nr:hypothetical protein [Bacteroidales bacterium]
MCIIGRNILILTLLFTSFEVNAQQRFPFIEPDAVQVFGELERAQVDHLTNLYLKNTTYPRDLIHGREYIRYWYNSKDNPLLRSDEERSASIVFRGRSYDNIVLQYDTFTDQVIYTDDTLIFNNRMWQVALNGDYIERFDLRFGNEILRFRYFRKEQDSTFNLQDGIYEVVYDNACKYIIRHISTRAIIDGVDEYTYAPVGYIKVSNGYSEISSKEQFLRLFGDRYAEVRQLIRHNNIRIRKPDKWQIAEVLKYYEELNHISQ